MFSLNLKIIVQPHAVLGADGKGEEFPEDLAGLGGLPLAGPRPAHATALRLLVLGGGGGQRLLAAFLLPTGTQLLEHFRH